MANPHGQMVDRFYSGGKGVEECWFALLAANEVAWETGNVSKILTDEGLVKQMAKLFPKRTSKLMKTPSRIRSAYNRKQKGAKSYRYVRSSGGRVCRSTSRGKPDSEWKVPRKEC